MFEIAKAASVDLRKYYKIGQNNWIIYSVLEGKIW